MENAEINNIIKILGLQYKKNYSDPDSLKTLRYGRLMIMTDQVCTVSELYSSNLGTLTYLGHIEFGCCVLDKELCAVINFLYLLSSFECGQDQDGSHIKGLLINFIHHNWPSLLRHNFLEEFITPIIKVGGTV